MTGRERVMTAVAHGEPDRVPRDLGATPSSGISAIAYGRLSLARGWHTAPPRIYDVVQQLAQPEECVLDCFGIDAVDVGRAFHTQPEDWKPFLLADGSTGQIPAWFSPVQLPGGALGAYADGELIARMPRGATFFDGTVVPYPDEIPQDLSDLDRQMRRILWSRLVHAPWDQAGEPGFWQELRRRALALRASTDRAIVVVCGCNLFEWGTFLRRMDNFLCDLLLDPPGVERLMDALMERHLATLEQVCRAVGDVCDILRFGDDLGMDSGPLMQPELYRRYFKPRHTALNAYVHTHSRMKTLLHSCGSLYRLMPDLVEAGYDILNPVQINAREMDPARLKREFGSDICFWGGGADTRNVLNRGTPGQVRDHVLRLVDIFAPGGGYVFNTVHNIMPDVPPENISAMFAALDE